MEVRKIIYTNELTTEEWRLIRQTLKIILRQDKQLRNSDKVAKALEQITDETSQRLFKSYYIEGNGIIKCSLTFHYEESVIRRKLNQASKEFAQAWNNGALIKLFKDK
ncbi:MAG: hypothetical protein LBV19_06135 [Streptococcaceae bacterium]|nr:hypothetical protein [Streptococcaceae bacterium]